MTAKKPEIAVDDRVRNGAGETGAVTATFAEDRTCEVKWDHRDDMPHTKHLWRDLVKDERKTPGA